MSQTIIKEFCAENFTDIPRAVAAGAKRIELCDNLAAGGTSPSYGVIKKAVEYTRAYDVAVMTMIRPRGGDFVYSEDELDIMLENIRVCRNLGSDGVVFGCLKEGWLDEEMLEKLISASEGMDITFHMAFDELEVEKQFAAIDWLSKRGVKRILTHGGSGEKPIKETIGHIKELIAYSKGRIIILPGGQITYENVQEITATLGVEEAHGTKIVKGEGRA